MIDDPKNLLPSADWHTRAMIRKLAGEYQRLTKHGVRIRSGRRTCEEQDTIYAQGRSYPGPIVTNARGCKSWHVTGRAVDLDPFDPQTGQTLPGYSDHYRVLGAIWKKLGGQWGGDFSGLYDPGHFEWHPGIAIEDICPADMRCADLRVRRSVPTYLIASGTVLAVTMGIFVATVTMNPARS